MTRNIITATIAVLAASVAVLVSIDDASARGFRGGASGGGYQRSASHSGRNVGMRSVSHRAAQPRVSAPHRSSGQFSPRVSRATQPRINQGMSARVNRVAQPRVNNGQFARRTNQPALPRTNQAALPRINQGALARTNQGQFAPRSAGLNSSQVNTGRSLPRVNLAQFDRSRTFASANPNSAGLPKPNLNGGRSGTTTGRAYGDQMGPATNTPQNANGSNTSQKNPPPVRTGNGQPTPGQQILINWGKSFSKGVGGGLTYDLKSAGTAFSLCQNLATLCAGGSVPLGAWLAAPLPGVASNLFDGAVNSFTPTDPNDPLSTPFDNSVRNAVKGAQSIDLNPFDNIPTPPAWK